MEIPFNKPYITGNEERYIHEVIAARRLAGNGVFTRRCQEAMRERTGRGRCLLTTSCTDALEMAALLADIGEGDEVIMPSYTFVSTANAFALRGANIVFADSGPASPNIDVHGIEALVTPWTRAIVAMHYAGVACDMDAILDIAARHDLVVIEDAAQAMGAAYRGRPLGTFGSTAAFSFHETKNITAGEGGMLVVNDPNLVSRAEIIWEKGTNRSAFLRGEIGKYGWMDVGSSFLPSELTAAFLCAQFEAFDDIQAKRLVAWDRYHRNLRPLGEAGHLHLPVIPDGASNNAHMYHVVCNGARERTALLAWLRERGVHAVFHYLPLHSSPYYAGRHDGRRLPHADRYGSCLLRLPLFTEITPAEIDYVCDRIGEFFAR